MARSLGRICGGIDLCRRNQPAHVAHICGAHARMLRIEIRDQEVVDGFCPMLRGFIYKFVKLLAVLCKISWELIVLHLHRIAEGLGVGNLFLCIFRHLHLAEVFPEELLQHLIGNCIGAAVNELLLHGGIRHHGRSQGNPVHTLLKSQGLLGPDGAHHIEHLCPGLHHIG